MAYLVIAGKLPNKFNKSTNPMWLHYLIESFFALGLFVNAALFVPQIIKLYKAKHANEVSLITFGGFNLINLFTVLHGIIAKDLLLSIGYTFSLIANTCVTGLIVWYRFINKSSQGS